MFFSGPVICWCMAKLEELQPGTVADPEAPAETPSNNGAQAAANPDLRYYALKKQIETGGRIKQKIERLLIDSNELSYNDYMELLDRYISEVPKPMRDRYNHESQDKRFLQLVICKLNPPMIETDFAQIGFGDAWRLFLRAQASIYSEQSAKTE